MCSTTGRQTLLTHISGLHWAHCLAEVDQHALRLPSLCTGHLWLIIRSSLLDADTCVTGAQCIGATESASGRCTANSTQVWHKPGILSVFRLGCLLFLPTWSLVTKANQICQNSWTAAMPVGSTAAVHATSVCYNPACRPPIRTKSPIVPFPARPAVHNADNCSRRDLPWPTKVQCQAQTIICWILSHSH